MLPCVFAATRIALEDWGLTVSRTFGGETLTGLGAQPGNVYERVDVYDPVTNQWSLEAPLPTARHGLFPVAWEDKLYLAGGGVVSGF